MATRIRLDKERWRKRVKEFYDKELISVEQRNSLSEMIDSPDNENSAMVELVAKTYIKNTLSNSLNDEQKASFEDILEHFENPQHTAVVLKGYAGTGKTFLVKKIIEYIMQTEPAKKMAITAPTNKAVKVLYANSASNISGEEAFIFEDLFDSDSRLVYSTTHKFLGMKEIITDTGEQLFEVDTMNRSSWSNFSYLLVDEVSMLDDKLTKVILENKKLKVLFIGDPAQIPPVNRQDSIPLLGDNDKYTFKETRLNTIMRQKGDNPIIQHSFTIRENLQNPKPIPLVKTFLTADGGVEVIKPEPKSILLREVIKKYVTSIKFKASPDYFKILVWRRNSVSQMNAIVREQLYGPNPPRFVVGERLIAQKPIFKRVVFKSKRGDKKYWQVRISNSEEMTIDRIEKTTITLQHFKESKVFDAYELFVSYENILSNKTCVESIKVIHESQEKEYFALIENIKDIAKRNRNNALWVMYFDYLKYSADVGYNYALTVHRS